MSDVHSCSYYCDRPACVKAQRDELRNKLEKQEPIGWIYEDDEGRMMFSQMPHPDPLWEPVYRKTKNA